MIKFNFTGEMTRIAGRNDSEAPRKKKTICEKCKKKVNKLYTMKIDGKDMAICAECKKDLK
jgi:hypothetical protein